MLPTCSKSDLAGRKALSAAALTIRRSTASGLRASRGDLHAPPAHERADGAVARRDMPGLAAGVTGLLVGDPLPLVLLRRARHLLDVAARALLAAALARLLVAHLGDLLEQRVARALEVADVCHARLGLEQRMPGIAAAQIACVLGELLLEPRDLAAQLAPGRRLV